MILALLLCALSVPNDRFAAAVAAEIEPWTRPDGPGGALAVLRGDEVVLARAFGAARLDPPRSMTTDTPVYLASLAKPFTAACAVHAARAGTLDLDAPLTEAFPELPEAYAAASLRQCLHHRSGIADAYDVAILADLGSGAVAANARVIELLARLPHLSSPPGTRCLYSNSGYVLLAEALRRATGTELAAYAHENLFEPLGMRSASFGPPPEDAALAYADTGAGFETRRFATGLTGPGGMFASLDDLIAFARAWRRGAWGDEGLRAELLAVPTGPRHPILGGYSAGWMHQRLLGQRVERHFGGAFGFSADFLRVPELDLTVIALSNASDLDASDLGPAILALLVPASAEERVPAAAGTGDPSSLAGAWRDAAGRLVLLLPRPEGLRLAALGDLRADLVAAGAARFEAVDVQAPLAVELVDGELRLEEDGVVSRMLRVPPDPRPDAQEVAGEYASAVLGARLRLATGPSGTVVLEQRDPILELTPFHPFARDLLVCDRGAALTLERDAQGRVTGLVGNANRAFGLRFERVR